MRYLKILIITLFLFSPLTSFSLEMDQWPVIPYSGGTAYSNYLYATPPTIESVRFSPQEPQPQVPIQVTAIIYNDPVKTDIETVSSILRYSTDDGNTWEEISMDQDESDNKLWQATIPGQPEGTEIIFSISAMDAVGNVATEMPLKIKEWPPVDSSNLILAAEDPDEPDQVVLPDLDVLQSYAGYDDEYLYLKIKFEGKINPGTLKPPFLHSYIGGIINLDKGLDILGGYLVIYMPHLKLANEPECISYDLGRMRIEYDYPPLFYVKEDTLYLGIPRKLLGNNPSGQLRLIYGTVAITSLRIRDKSTLGGVPVGIIDFMEFMLKRFRASQIVTLEDIDLIRQNIYFQDASPYTNIYLRTHKITVKKPELKLIP